MGLREGAFDGSSVMFRKGKGKGKGRREGGVGVWLVWGEGKGEEGI